MSMTTQEWVNVESKRYPREPKEPTKPRKPADPMAYLAVLVIVAEISILVMVFYSIKQVCEHSPNRPHINSLSNAHEN